MAKRKTIKFNTTTLIILVALVVIVGLLVALAYSPVGQGILEGLGNGTQNGGNGGSFSQKRIVKLGGHAIDKDQNILLENVVCQIHFIDVAQGDAILIQFDDGTDILIDGGSTSTGLAEIRTSYINYLMGAGIVDSIDYMIVTHPDTDHYNMFSYVLDSFVVENIMYNDMVKNSVQTYENFKTKAQDEVSSEHLYKIDADGAFYDNFVSGTGYELDIYAPGYNTFQDEDAEYDSEESNGMSPIIVLTVNETTVLLTGDATFETEEWFVDQLGSSTLDIDVLKVGHHGAAGSTGEAFLNAINAEYAIISSDEGGAYAHPRPELMTRLFNAGVVTYRTSRHGDIVLNIDQTGAFAFEVDNEVMVENNTKHIDDKMLITQAGE